MGNVVGCDEANAAVRGDNLTFRTPEPHKVHQPWRWLPWNVFMTALATGLDHEITSLWLEDYQGPGPEGPG